MVPVRDVEQEGGGQQNQMIERGWIARIWQFAGIVVLTHAATRHVMYLKYRDNFGGPEADPEIPSSWSRLLIGVFVGILLFWTGIYLEGRSPRKS